MTARDALVAILTLLTLALVTYVARVVVVLRRRTETWARFGPVSGKRLGWRHLLGYTAVHPIRGTRAIAVTQIRRVRPAHPKPEPIRLADWLATTPTEEPRS